jgi:hypothetical protein
MLSENGNDIDKDITIPAQKGTECHSGIINVPTPEGVLFISVWCICIYQALNSDICNLGWNAFDADHAYTSTQNSRLY